MSEPWLKYSAVTDQAATKPWEKYRDPTAALHPDLPDGYDRALAAARKATTHDSVPQAIYEGITLGFGKDIDALGAEGVTGIENLVHRLKKERSPYSAEEAGAAVKQAEKEEAEEFGKKHPYVRGALEFGGGMLTPGLGLANKGLRALGVASPVARAMGLGGGLGAATAVGESDGALGHRLSAAPGGAVAGAATGGTLERIGHASGMLGRILGPGMQEAGARLKERAGGVEPGEVTPRARAEAKKAGPAIADQMARKLDPDGSKLWNNEAEKLGVDITAAEAMGPQAVGKLSAYGRLSGQTPEALYNAMWDRIKGTPQAIVDDFSRVTGVDADAAVGDIDKLNTSLKARTGPAYDAFYASGPIKSEQIDAVLKTPAGKKALAEASNWAANRQIDPFTIGFAPTEIQVVKDGIPLFRGDGSPVMMPGDGVKLKTPTPMALDFLKRALDTKVESYRDPITKQLKLDTEGLGYKEVRDSLRAEMTRDDAAWGPLYRTALDAGGEPIRNQEAFYKDAPKVLSTRLKTFEFDKLMKSYETKKGAEEPAHLQALRAGVVNDIREMAERADVAGLKKLRSDESKRRLGKVFSPEQADEISKLLNHRIMLLETAKQMLPTSGSRTSRDLAAMEEDRRDVKQALNSASHLLSGHPRRAISSAIHYVLEGAWDRAQAGADEATRDVTGALLMMSPSEFTAALEKAGASKSEAMKAMHKLTDVGWFAPRMGGRAGETRRKSGVSMEIEGRPDTRIDLGPDLQPVAPVP